MSDLSDSPENYRIGPHGLPIHHSLDALAEELIKATVANKGICPDPYFIPADKWHKLVKYEGEANGGPSVAKMGCEYMNFIFRGVAVCPAEPQFNADGSYSLIQKRNGKVYSGGSDLEIVVPSAGSSQNV